MTLPKSALPARQERSRETVARLLDATEVVLRKAGLEGATVEAIADEAEVSPGIVYRRFADKDALLRSVYERYFETRANANADALAPERWKGCSSEAIVRAFVAGAIEGAARERRLIDALHRFAATHADARFRRDAHRVNARTHTQLTQLLVAAGTPKKNAAFLSSPERVAFAVDVLLFALRGYLVDLAPAGGAVPAKEWLVEELTTMTTRYLSRPRT